MKPYQHAIRAPQNRHIWGRFATLQYVNWHTTLRLYRIACQLEAMAKEEAREHMRQTTRAALSSLVGNMTSHDPLSWLRGGLGR